MSSRCPSVPKQQQLLASSNRQLDEVQLDSLNLASISFFQLAPAKATATHLSVCVCVCVPTKRTAAGAGCVY